MIAARLGRLLRLRPAELARAVAAAVVARLAPAHRTNASGNNQSQR